MNSATTRFSDRVEDYIRYRPGYPREIKTLLAEQCGLSPDSAIADVGSGTGISAQLFLESGNLVYAVEPNTEMRAAAERLLGHYAHLRSIAGTAEATTLESESLDFIIAGQAFHWFDRQAARKEFERILRPMGWVVVLWNQRRVDSTPFLMAYEALLKTHGTDYCDVDHRRVGETGIEEFFGPGNFRLATFDNRQILDWHGLLGRLNSSSYVPRPGEGGYDEMVAQLKTIFDTHQSDGVTHMDYDTLVYFGQLLRPAK